MAAADFPAPPEPGLVHFNHQPGFVADINAACDRERRYQDIVHPDQARSAAGYLMVLRHELAEAETAWMSTDGDAAPEVLAEVLQIMAVARACLERHGYVERRYPPEYHLAIYHPEALPPANHDRG